MDALITQWNLEIDTNELHRTEKCLEEVGSQYNAQPTVAGPLRMLSFDANS